MPEANEQCFCNVGNFSSTLVCLHSFYLSLRLEQWWRTFTLTKVKICSHEIHTRISKVSKTCMSSYLFNRSLNCNLALSPHTYVYKHITNENTDNFNSNQLQILLQNKQAFYHTIKWVLTFKISKIEFSVECYKLVIKNISECCILKSNFLFLPCLWLVKLFSH